jgi:hypothetical protein
VLRRLKVFMFIYLLLACATSWFGFLSQATALAQNAEPSGLAVVEGSVVNKITGAPIKHAHVMYLKAGSGDRGAVAGSKDADSEGRFAIQVAPGSYQLWAEQSGFIRQYYGSRTPDGPQAALVLASGQQAHAVLQLAPLGAISGHVFDEDADPLQGATIQVMRFNYTTGRRQLTPVNGTSTDDRGEYRAYGLPAGRYLLLCTRREWPPYAGLLYPGVADVASATEIFLSDGGDVTGIDFTLPTIHLVTLRGRLESPVPHFAESQLQVVLAHREGNAASLLGRAAAVVSQTTGTFEVRDVMPGSYWLVAAQLYSKYALSGRVPLEVVDASPPENITVPLASGFEIGGRAEIDGVGKLPEFKVGMRAVEGLTFGPQPVSAVDSQGNVRLAGLTPGLWEFMTDSLPDNFCVKTATLNSSDLLSQTVSLTGDPRQTVHIVVSPRCPEIAGTVLDENGQPHRATVVLAPAEVESRASPGAFRAVSSDEQGAFSFKGVRPGSYKLFALEDVAAFAWLDPEFLSSVESMGESVSVAEGDRATIRVVPIPAEGR